MISCKFGNNVYTFGEWENIVENSNSYWIRRAINTDYAQLIVYDNYDYDLEMSLFDFHISNMMDMADYKEYIQLKDRIFSYPQDIFDTEEEAKNASDKFLKIVTNLKSFI